MKPRYIVHIDMDAFFASVEQRDHPEYKGQPVIIGSDPKGGRGRGVVSTCSYEARKYGIHSAMPISKAYERCPHGIYLRGSMRKYAEVSDTILDILETFTPDIQPISIDEAFLDITGSYRHFGGPLKTCKLIKQTIKDITGLTASLGMAPNMMTAKIASDIKKPDGLVVIEPDDLIPFLYPLPIKRLWGIGRKTEQALNKLGIFNIGDIASYNKDTLIDTLGTHGEHLWQLSHGIDDRTVETDDTVKSISNEHTFTSDTRNPDEIKDIIMYLTGKVSNRLRSSRFKCRTITLKIRFSDFSTYTRSKTLDIPTNFISDIYGTILDLLEEFNIKRRAVRLVGVRSSNLIDTKWESDLFHSKDKHTSKQEAIHTAIDSIKNKFGSRSIGFRGI